MTKLNFTEANKILDGLVTLSFKVEAAFETPERPDRIVWSQLELLKSAEHIRNVVSKDDRVEGEYSYHERELAKMIVAILLFARRNHLSVAPAVINELDTLFTKTHNGTH